MWVEQVVRKAARVILLPPAAGDTPQAAKADQSRRSLLNTQRKVYSGTGGEDNMGIGIARGVLSRIQLWARRKQ